MDTVQEEVSTATPTCSTPEAKECQPLLYGNALAIPSNQENSLQKNPCDNDHGNSDLSALSSRRPSVIIAALRRPSQAIALSAAQAVMSQRRYFLGLFQGQADRSIGTEGSADAEKEKKLRKHNRKLGDDALTTILSALYAKLVVVLGMAFPITEIISPNVRQFFYQGFYLYLYLGSISFVSYMYATLIREKTMFSIMRTYDKTEEKAYGTSKKRGATENLPPERYGSFYLRLGAIAFGIGSMVYSGLEFGRYFELKNYPDCYPNILQAITPATRMLLTLVQVQFIFLNSKDLELNRHGIIARFGLMHMIAANLCEWLLVLVEETKHEIVHLEHPNTTNGTTNDKFCQEGNVMGSLVANASAFLFPCKIEYSLICAVILFEMWKKVKSVQVRTEKESTKQAVPNQNQEKVSFNVPSYGDSFMQSHLHFSVDCSSSHRGLFGGILVIVLTIISLIMFFVLTNEAQTGENKLLYRGMAEFEVNIVELILYTITTICVIVAMVQMRDLKYERKRGEGEKGIGLDNTLLVVAQTGMFIYCMFSIIGCYFTLPMQSAASILADIFSLVQTVLQTMFVLDSCWRRCKSFEQTTKKPGRELITFLIVANMAMWTINSLMKNRAEFRPTHLKFFGDWAWTIITHISMPLAIFYRFHSTICLFEIWKSAYKIKRFSRNNPLFAYV